MNFKTLIRKRRSTRKFMLGKKKADWRRVIRALDSARFIPSAGNQFNLKYIMVRDPELIEHLSEMAQQQFIRDAHYVLICVSDEEALERMYGERGRRYTAQHAGASIQNLLLALTEEGLSATWIGYFHDDMVKDLLRIPDKYVVEAMIPLGIGAKNASTKQSKKSELDTILFFDEWGNKEMEKQYRISNEGV